MRLFITLILAASIGASQARAQERPGDRLASDLIHSDLPLFGNGTEDIWPRHFYQEDSFGCVSRIAFGDWVFRQQGHEADDRPVWYRIQNYGAFHCWALVGSAHQREGLEGAELRPSFFVFLGTTEAENEVVELWAAQMGARPGSDYLLLSRPHDDGVIETFSVLQRQCPRGSVRDAGALDILRTRYCAIASRGELLRLARRMAQRPPLGALALAQPERGEEGHTGEDRE